MKVLYITKDAKPNSGWGRLTLENKIAYEKLGFEVELFCVNSRKGVIVFLKDIFLAIKLGKKCDYIHASDLWSYGLFAYIASGCGKKKYLINGVGTYTIEPLKKTGFKKPMSILCKMILRKATAIACISKYTKNQIDENVKGVNTQVVLMGLSKMDNIISNENILKKYNIDENSFPVICTVGEIKHRKGQLDTAKAVAILKEKYPKIKYLIVGKSQQNYVEKILEIDKNLGGDVIKIINDAKRDEELKAVYERSDIFALNSNNDEFGHFEGFGLVILEANQFGVPAVGSKNCGIEDAIKYGENGYLCEQGNVEDIKNKMEMILEKKVNDKNYWQEKSKSWANNFSWDKAAKLYVSLLK